MLARKRGDLRLDEQQQAVFKALQQSYLQLVFEAGTEDKERLTDYANRGKR